MELKYLVEMVSGLPYIILNHHRRIIGSFIAASNISGILNDDLAITAILHSHGALERCSVLS